VWAKQMHSVGDSAFVIWAEGRGPDARIKLEFREAGMIATLRIQVLFHWDSDQARQLATRLYQTFSARPMGDGPRIPVRYGPRQVDGGPPVVPENHIRTDSCDEAESAHDPTRCVQSSVCLGRLSATCSSRGAGLESRISFSDISSI
jgi:hypothetical protein